MKKFTRILICLILCVFTIGLAACGDNQDNFTYPTASMQTYGNGGLSVQKGDYLYFVNGYQSADNMTEKNASYHVGALMIAKLDENGNLILNDEGLLGDDYYRVMSDKLCGFEATGLYIFGDYLYFTSPCQENEAGTDGEWAKGRVDFYRIRLDDSGSVEKLYTSGVENENLQYEYYYDGNNTFILVYESGDTLNSSGGTNILKRIDANDASSTEISRDVSSVVMADDSDKIFYVTTDDDERCVLNKYDIVNNNSSQYLGKFTNEITAKFVVNGYVYIEETHGSNMDLKRSRISTSGAFTDFVPGISNYTTYEITPNGEMVIGITDNVIDFYLFGNTSPSLNFVEDADIETINFIGFANGSIVYYDDNNAIKMVSYANFISNPGLTPEIVTLATLSDVNTDYFDLDDNYLYFYKTVGSNSYLHRLSVNNNNGETEEMVGVYLEADIPDEEEETEEESEESAN